jgi:hypothetical protein
MKTITLAGFVWATEEHKGKSILMLGSHKRGDAKSTEGLITHPFYFERTTDPKLLEADAQVIVTATIEETSGSAPVYTASRIEAFDDRPVDEWKRYF